MKRPLFIVRIVLLMIACLSLSSSLFAQGTTKTYTFGIIPHLTLGPVIVANAKGLFAAEGITVKLEYYRAIDESNKAIRFGKVDLARVSAATQMEWWGKDANLKTIASIGYSQGAPALIIKKTIQPQDFLTQPVGILSDSFLFKWMVWEYLKPQNIPIDKINFVVMPPEELYKNFIKGRLQIIVVLGAFPEKAVAEGNGVIVNQVTPQKGLGAYVMPMAVYQATPKEDLKRLNRALVKAIQWINDPANEQEFFAILQQTFAADLKTVNLETIEGFKKVRNEQIILSPQALYHQNTVTVAESYNTIKEARAAMGLSADFTAADVVDTGAMLEVLEEMGLKPQQ